MNLRACVRLIFLLLAVVMLVGPQLADARAGGGMSGGSRGMSRSYPSAPSYNYNNPAYNPPQGSPFLRGMFGGLLGAGLFSMLFGSWGGGTGVGLLPIILLVTVIYMIRRQFAGVIRPPGLGIPNTPYSNNAPPNAQTIAITDADKEAFTQIHADIQHAWSEGDMNRLGQHLTPEMLHYFDCELAVNSSHGIANKIEQVILQHANILEAWHEYDTDYATARLEWSALDYNVRTHRQPYDSDYVASGSLLVPDTVTEIWTFARPPGGHWVLSAIQQVA